MFTAPLNYAAPDDYTRRTVYNVIANIYIHYFKRAHYLVVHIKRISPIHFLYNHNIISHIKLPCVIVVTQLIELDYRLFKNSQVSCNEC